MSEMPVYDKISQTLLKTKDGQGRVAAHFRRDEVELDDLTDLVARVA